MARYNSNNNIISVIEFQEGEVEFFWGVWIRWTGTVEWNGGMDWTGLEWNGMEWNDQRNAM